MQCLFTFSLNLLSIFFLCFVRGCYCCIKFICVSTDCSLLGTLSPLCDRTPGCSLMRVCVMAYCVWSNYLKKIVCLLMASWHPDFLTEFRCRDPRLGGGYPLKTARKVTILLSLHFVCSSEQVEVYSVWLAYVINLCTMFGLIIGYTIYLLIYVDVWVHCAAYYHAIVANLYQFSD